MVESNPPALISCIRINPPRHTVPYQSAPLLPRRSVPIASIDDLPEFGFARLRIDFPLTPLVDLDAPFDLDRNNFITRVAARKRRAQYRGKLLAFHDLFVFRVAPVVHGFGEVAAVRDLARVVAFYFVFVEIGCFWGCRGGFWILCDCGCSGGRLGLCGLCYDCEHGGCAAAWSGGDRDCAGFWVRAARRVVVGIVDVRGASQFLFFGLFFFWAKRVTREGWKGVKGIGGTCAAWAGWPTTGRQAC